MMNVNKPAGALQESLPPIEHHVAAAPAALTSPSAAAASAAASASAASEAASQTRPRNITQVALHLLGTAAPASSAAALAASPVEASLPAAPQYATELALGGISDPVRSAVALAVDSLTVTGEQACALLAQRERFPTLDALYLTNCDDADLIRLAEVLRTTPHVALSITLDRDAGVYVSANGLRAIAGATLAGLHLKGLAISPDAAEALARSQSSVSISLLFHADGITNVYWLTQISTLTSLDAGRHHVSAASIAALAAHPNLTALRLNTLPGADIRAILASQPLRSFSVGGIPRDESEAFEAFADNRSLKSLTVGSVKHAESLITLSRNTTLTSVDLHLHRSASAGIQHLANLPALDALAISYMSVMLMPGDVQALCAEPLSSLRISAMTIDSAALELIVRAQAASLSMVTFNQPFTDTIVDALVANERISALTVLHRMIDERRALRLIASPTLEKLTVEFDSDVPDIAEDYYKKTWLAAGKLLENLELSVFPIEDEPEVVALGLL